MTGRGHPARWLAFSGLPAEGWVQEDKSESNTLHVGGGGGLALRILRSTVLQFNFAGGPDGFLFSIGTGWAF